MLCGVFLPVGLTDSDIADLAAMAKAEYSLGAPGRPSPVPATTAHVPAPARRHRLCRLTLFATSLRECLGVRPRNLCTGRLNSDLWRQRLRKIWSHSDTQKGRARARARRYHPPQRIRTRPPKTGERGHRISCRHRESERLMGGWRYNRSRIVPAQCLRCMLRRSADRGGQSLAYTPRILQTFQDLAEACRAVGAKLRAEQEALERSRPPQLNQLALRPQTQAGVLAANLSVRTTNKEIDALCDLTAEERERHAALGRALQDNRTVKRTSSMRVHIV